MHSNMLAVLVVVGSFAWILFNQIRVRTVRRRTYLPFVFIGLGAVMTGRFFTQQPITIRAIGCVAVGLAVGVLLAAARVPTIRVWSEQDVWRRAGGWKTVAMWLASLAIHFALNVLAGRGVGVVTSLLHLGIVLAVQNHLLRRRVRALEVTRAHHR